MPIPYDAPRAEVERLFRAINGALIPGGGQNLSPHHPFFDTSALLLNLSIAATDAGDFFPVRDVASLMSMLSMNSNSGLRGCKRVMAAASGRGSCFASK